jgi:hypothetical protein
MFFDLKFSVRLLSYMIETITTITQADVIIQISNHDASPMCAAALGRVGKVFTPLEHSEYKDLLEIVTIAQNGYVITWLNKKIKETAPFAKVPVWVQNFGPDKLPTHRELLASIPSKVPAFTVEEITGISIDQAVVRLTEGIERLGYDVENKSAILESVRTQYALSTPQQRLEIMRPLLIRDYKAEKSSELEIFRTLGPVNTILNMDFTINHVCTNWGGCRMFTCVCLDGIAWDSMEDDSLYSQEIGTGGRVWFRGSCDGCNQRIYSFCHAFRLPFPHGGWKGCYCSAECASQDVDTVDSSEEGNELIIKDMIDRISDQLIVKGIQDRDD